MKDSDLADELIKRLNELVKDPEVARDVWELLETRIPVTKATADHPTIQIVRPTSFFPGTTNAMLGFLGLLNGLVGVIEEGQDKGWGYIAAKYEDNHNLTFMRVGGS